MIARAPTDLDPPEEILRETERAWEGARGAVRSGIVVEVYTRRSHRIRVRAEGSGARVDERGRDAGIAVRAHDPATSTVGFASSTGSAEAASTSLARIADAARCGIPGSDPPWARREGVVLRDLEAPLSLPSPERLHGWLDRGLGGSAERRPTTLWVEAAATVESVAAEGLSWVRSRGRVWAVRLEAGGGELGRGASLPRSAAARRLEELPPFASWPSDPVAGEPPAPGPWVMAPEALAVLVPALTRTLHSFPGPIGTEVGGGWVLQDDPQHQAALFGGTFDDSGFETRFRPLALNGRVVGSLEGPGTYRRGSYRDRPEATPSLLVVDPPEIPAPDRGLLVRSIDLEVGGPRAWILRVEGERWTRAGAAGGCCRATLRTDPATLTRACVGGTGVPARCGWRVFSPPLVFEGLEAGD